jgi:phosphomannomutase
MLSVSGARGIVGSTMTPAVAADFAAAFGSFIRRSTGEKAPTLCIGRDSRPSGEMLAHAAIAGLVSVGCRVIELGIVTTPSVAVMIGKHRAAGGMAVTASHNPIIWNGLKCLNRDGVAPPPNDAAEIIRRYKERDIQPAPVEALLPVGRDATSHQTHIGKVLAQVDPKPVRAAKLKVVLDSVNGAGCVPGRELLHQLGCDVVHLNGEPTGLFAHVPEPTEANLTDLAATAKRERAACGFAQDPDADRLAIIDEHGRYIGEEYTLVLAAKRLLDLASSKPGLRSSELLLAANLSTSRMIDDLAAGYPDTRVIRTAVGEANVVAGLQSQADAKSTVLLGGEGNGGVILPGVCWVRDSLSAMALVLDLIVAEGRPLSAIVNGLPRYAMIKHKFDLASLGGNAFVQGALQRVTKRFKDERISTLDGVRIDTAEGWVHLRASNTEPIIRLIAEAKTESGAWRLIDEAAAAAGLK